MTTSAATFNSPFQPPMLWQRLVNTNRFLAFNLFIYLALLLFTIGASFVDTRLVTGAPVWMKPLKFAISSFLYLGTLLWMLSFVQGKRRLVHTIAIASTIGFLVEIGAIVLQAFRGVPSHFNNATPFDSLVFSLMGLFVLVIWFMNLAAAILLFRERLSDAILAWSLRLGLVITIVGGATGALMTSGPTPTQLAALEAGKTVNMIGAHSVGVEDGGAGLPLVGWSTEGGDLRVGHFVGLHGLQVVPLLGLFVRRRWGERLSVRRQTILVWIGAGGYLGLTLLLTWQALRGQPLIAPDGLTLMTAATLLTAVCGGFWMVNREPVSQ